MNIDKSVIKKMYCIYSKDLALKYKIYYNVKSQHPNYLILSNYKLFLSDKV